LRCCPLVLYAAVKNGTEIDVLRMTSPLLSATMLLKNMDSIVVSAQSVLIVLGIYSSKKGKKKNTPEITQYLRSRIALIRHDGPVGSSQGREQRAASPSATFDKAAWWPKGDVQARSDEFRSTTR
jgi:hypothetical protein